MKLPETLSELISFEANNGRVRSREGKHCEFKEEFRREHIPKYLKSLSAFANADGGKIIFGVSDSPRTIVGVDLTSIADEAEITNLAAQHFDPELSFEAKDYRVNGLDVYVLAIALSPVRPVICKKGKNVQFERRGQPITKEILSEGAIYFRYSAKTERIKYNELQQIIKDREQNNLKAIIETLKLAEKVGFNSVGIVDAKNYGEATSPTELLITEETAKSLNFIDEGRFVEKSSDGAPAYYVMGKVNLQQVVMGELDDEDKNLPNEVATRIRETIQNLYGEHVAISASQVGKILTEFDLRKMPYFQEDTKIDRKYITREGIAAILECMNREPLRFLRSFSSKPNIAAYEAENE